MANKKITDLNEATSVSGNDWLVIVDVANDETKKVHANQVGGNIPIQDTAPQDPEEDDLWIDTSENVGGTNILDTIFPIGSIVIKADNEDYSNWLGFTWERTLVGRVAVGIDSNDTTFDTIGETGGAKTHTLSIDQLPSHSHTVHPEVYMNAWGSSSKYFGSGSGTYMNTESQGGRGTYSTGTAGSGQAHNNLQPYQVVAYWKRTA